MFFSDNFLLVWKFWFHFGNYTTEYFFKKTQNLESAYFNHMRQILMKNVIPIFILTPLWTWRSNFKASWRIRFSWNRESILVSSKDNMLLFSLEWSDGANWHDEIGRYAILQVCKDKEFKIGQKFHIKCYCLLTIS